MSEDARAKAEIDLAVRIFAGLLLRHVPALVTGLYLVGSAALGDFRPGRSGLDFVAELSRSASDDDVEALVILHRLYAADPTLPPLQGIWVTGDELAAGPDASATGLSTAANQVLAAASGGRNPVTWFVLHQHPHPVLGAIEPTRLWHDPARLAGWSRTQAARRWAPWLVRSSRPLSPGGLDLLGAGAIERSVLGISRLHVTLSTGRIVSGLAAGAHARATFGPRWHRIIDEALRLRRGERGGRYHNPLRRRSDALGYVAMVLARIGQDQPASE